MIVCPNCNHQNPDGAVQCEACYTPLPATANCPSCGATVQADAGFCGQCGFNLKADPVKAAGIGKVAPTAPVGAFIPELVQADPLIAPDPLVVGSQPPKVEAPAVPPPLTEPPAPVPVPAPAQTTQVPPPAAAGSPKTQLQQQTARLLHVQTNTVLELPQNLTVIHLGKPNDRIPPDIDVSGFPNSEVVSRIHADIRLEADAYYIEDVGSSNGTYINNTPLPLGNRHRLRPGDRIALGKGDRVTFLFQLS